MGLSVVGLVVSTGDGVCTKAGAKASDKAGLVAGLVAGVKLVFGSGVDDGDKIIVDTFCGDSSTIVRWWSCGLSI